MINIILIRKYLKDIISLMLEKREVQTSITLAFDRKYGSKKII